MPKQRGETERLPKDLVAASAVPLVLSVLVTGESYGYAIIQRIRQLSHGDLEWSDGMLYPLMQRLEQQGLVRARWKTAETGRKRRYYRITGQGERTLTRHQEHWGMINQVLGQLWEGSHV